MTIHIYLKNLQALKKMMMKGYSISSMNTFLSENQALKSAVGTCAISEKRKSNKIVKAKIWIFILVASILICIRHLQFQFHLKLFTIPNKKLQNSENIKRYTQLSFMLDKPLVS